MHDYLVFDYDGTLHNSNVIFAPAFREVYNELVELGFAEEHYFSDSDISRWTGYTVSDMWNEFMPGLPEELKTRSGRKIGELENDMIENGKARLYDGVPEMLAALKAQGFKLIFLSNCMRDYMDIHRSHFKLDNYFSAFYCAEDNDFRPKTQVLRDRIATRPGRYIMVGDRFHDIEAACFNNIPSIACHYGYGSPEELSRATFSVLSAQAIPNAVSAVLETYK